MSSRCFDGANYGLFTGNDAQMKAINKACVDEAKHLGVKVLLMGECGHAHRIMKRMMDSESGGVHCLSSRQLHGVDRRA